MNNPYFPLLVIFALAAVVVLALLLIQLSRSSVAPGAAVGVGPLQFVPAALLGTWFGLVIFKRLSDRFFALSVNVLLLGSGIGLMV